MIGRAAAVADVFGVQITGLPAWLIWAFIHLLYLITLQSRILVFIQWEVQDLTFNRGARLHRWFPQTSTSIMRCPLFEARHRDEGGAAPKFSLIPASRTAAGISQWIVGSIFGKRQCRSAER